MTRKYPAPETLRDLLIPELRELDGRLAQIRTACRILREKVVAVKRRCEADHLSEGDPHAPHYGPYTDLRDDLIILKPTAEKVIQTLSAELDHPAETEKERLTQLEYRMLLPGFERSMLITAREIDELASLLNLDEDVEPLSGAYEKPRR